jgi:hypothetical protein
MTEIQMPMFTRAAGANPNLVIRPHLDGYLMSGQWPEDLTIRFRKHTLEHGPDGWFHPSTHPLMGLKRLYYYLTSPKLWVPEPKEPKSVLTTTIGEALHGFVKSLLIDQGVLIKQMGCACGDPECDEWYWEDPLVRSKGHSDGRLELPVLGYPDGPKNFEFKTATPLMKLPDDLDLEGFKKKKPGYWAQQQEYMRMSGLPMTVLIFMQTGYPYEVREFHIPADPQFQEETAQKYALAIECADAVHEPPPCCWPGSPESKQCEARTVCPIALAG